MREPAGSLPPLDVVLAAPPPRRRAGRIGLVVLAAGGLILLGSALAVAGLGESYHPLPLAAAGGEFAVAPATGPGSGRIGRDRPRERLAALRPRGLYVVVDTYGNKLRVVRDGEVLREAVCSAGSGTVLRDPRDGRIWVFDTPIGERRIQRKVKDPVWVKPDWAFVEEGYLPPESFRERYDTFSLGEYGLYLGDGYIIHGTVFQTLLGRSVTHGCIRLGDEDLEFVYRQVPVGTRVYLF